MKLTGKAAFINKYGSQITFFLFSGFRVFQYYPDCFIKVGYLISVQPFLLF